MLAQMAATAGSIAVGSTIGHGISHMLFGGSNEAAAPPAQAAAPVQHQQQYSSGVSCEAQAKGMHSPVPDSNAESPHFLNTEFTKCLEKADLQSCSYYLDQLKAVSYTFVHSVFPSLIVPFFT